MSATSAAAERVDPRIDTVIGGRYRLLAKLGEGGMGVVYRGVHEALRKPVAVKFLTDTANADQELVARFQREAIATANLRHPNIAESTDYGQLPDGTFFLVMEYVDGRNLRQVASAERLPPARAFAILKQIGAALSFAHGLDVVHRDLKPDNVIVFDGRGERDLVKIIDFGIARMTSAFGGGKTGLTQVGTVFGTPDYMAPEQAMGQAVDARADQYALGAMAFELFTGKPPYASDNVASLMFMHVGAPIPRVTDVAPELPSALADVVEKMMGKLPEERFASVGDAVAALGSAIDAPTTSSQVPPVVLGQQSAPTGPVSVSTGPSGVPMGPLGVPRAPASTPSAPSAPAAAAPARTMSTAASRFPLRWALAAGATIATLVGGASLVALVVAIRAHASSADPDEVAAALALWNSGRYADGAAALRRLQSTHPGLEEDPAVATALSSALEDGEAEQWVDELMAQTAFGHSQAMGSALAGVAIHGSSARRDAALQLLRDRHDTLDDEERARVELRDAEDCDAVARAAGALASMDSDGASEDLDAVHGGSCKRILRRSKLCDECRGAGSVDDKPGGGAAKSKGKKKHGH